MFPTPFVSHAGSEYKPSPPPQVTHRPTHPHRPSREFHRVPATSTALEEVAYFKTYDVPISTGDLSTQFPSLRALHLEGTPLHVTFPKPTVESEKITLPSLERITLDQVPVCRGNWSPLTTFLTHRASSGTCSLHPGSIISVCEDKSSVSPFSEPLARVRSAVSCSGIR